MFKLLPTVLYPHLRHFVFLAPLLVAISVLPVAVSSTDRQPGPKWSFVAVVGGIAVVTFIWKVPVQSKSDMAFTIDAHCLLMYA
jgi:hypothetical protein